MRALELFSHRACFLHFIERQIVHSPSRFSVLFLEKSGDGQLECPRHPSRHPWRHPSEFLSGSVFKKLDELSTTFWPRLGRVVGWNDPTFSVASAPKRIFGVVPAQTCPRKVSTMQMSAISIP